MFNVKNEAIFAYLAKRLPVEVKEINGKDVFVLVWKHERLALDLGLDHEEIKSALNWADQNPNRALSLIFN